MTLEPTIELPAWSQCRNCKGIYMSMFYGEELGLQMHYRLRLNGLPDSICASHHEMVTDFSRLGELQSADQVGEPGTNPSTR